MPTASICAEAMSIDFPLPNSVARSLRTEIAKRTVGAVIHKRSNGLSTTAALENIDLSLKEGDRLGLIGHNGAGKSTLLRALAGVYPVTSGRLQCQGTITTLFNISFGVEPELSGRENIILRGLFAGHSREEVMNKSEEIADFTGLGEFLDLPFHSYSSGMKLRVAFAVSTAFPAEILLIDESIGVGDADFAKQSEQRITNLIGASGILVLASHSKVVLQKHCNKFLKLERGRAVSLTDTIPD